MNQKKRPETTLAHLVDTYEDLSEHEAHSRLYAIATWKGQEYERCSFLTKVGSELGVAGPDRSLRVNARKFLLRHVVSTLLPKADSGHSDTSEHVAAAEICVNFYSKDSDHTVDDKSSGDFRILHEFLSRTRSRRDDAEVRERWFQAVIYARLWELINWNWEAAFTLHRYLLPRVSSEALNLVCLTKHELRLALDASAWAIPDPGLPADTFKLMSQDLLRMQIVAGLAQNNVSYKKHAEVMLALIAQQVAQWGLFLSDHLGMIR